MSASFCVNAWICAPQATDRDLESFCERLDMTKEERKKKGREKKRRRGGENPPVLRFSTLPCVHSKRLRVYRQNPAC